MKRTYMITIEKSRFFGGYQWYLYSAEATLLATDVSRTVAQARQRAREAADDHTRRKAEVPIVETYEVEV